MQKWLALPHPELQMDTESAASNCVIPSYTRQIEMGFRAAMTPEQEARFTRILGCIQHILQWQQCIFGSEN